jgi:hypothetical protein
MKKGLLLLLFSITVAVGSCKKNKEYCWVCHTISTGDDVPQQCGKTESDIKKIEDQNQWNCTKQ